MTFARAFVSGQVTVYDACAAIILSVPTLKPFLFERNEVDFVLARYRLKTRFFHNETAFRSFQQLTLYSILVGNDRWDYADGRLGIGFGIESDFVGYSIRKGVRATLAGETHIEPHGESWAINGALTYSGREFNGNRIEGLLLNSRMANAVFDDSNPATRDLWTYPDTGEWDANRNTDEFIAALPTYKRHGLLAVTVNLQGGSPTAYYREPLFRKAMQKRGAAIDDSVVWRGVPSPASQPWDNGAFTPDGALLPDYRDRAERIIVSCDSLGMVVVLGIFYFGQDERLSDESAVCKALDDVCNWLLDAGHRNVLLEVNNETNIPRYEHDILQPDRVHELIERAKAHTRKAGRRLLVGTSYGGGRLPDENVLRASDYIMLHGNGVTEPNRIADMVRQTRAMPGYTPKPVMFTEDDHYNFDAPSNNYLAAVSEYASWGYFDAGGGAGGSASFGDYEHGYQNVPINWGINTPRKRAFFDLTRSITGAH